MRSSAVLVHIPEAEPVVGGWRLGHTYDAPLGVPPHVTLLFPFVPADELTGEVEERLARIVGAAEPFDVTFPRTARFPTLIYLEPHPSRPFSVLTEAIAAEWPEHPPYGAFCPAPGHQLGFNDLKTIEVRDLLVALGEGRSPWPDFAEGAAVQRVLEAALRSAAERRWVAVDEIA